MDGFVAVYYALYIDNIVPQPNPISSVSTWAIILGILKPEWRSTHTTTKNRTNFYIKIVV